MRNITLMLTREQMISDVTKAVEIRQSQALLESGMKSKQDQCAPTWRWNVSAKKIAQKGWKPWELSLQLATVHTALKTRSAMKMENGKRVECCATRLGPNPENAFPSITVKPLPWSLKSLIYLLSQYYFKSTLRRTDGQTSSVVWRNKMSQIDRPHLIITEFYLLQEDSLVS